MVIRDKYKLFEISDIIYEEKEDRFVFKDMRNRTLARLGLPSHKGNEIVEYTIRLMMKWNREYGYIDIYKLNRVVDNYTGESLPDDYGRPKEKTIPIKETFESKVVQKEEITVVPNNASNSVTKVATTIEKPASLPDIVEGFDTPIICTPAPQGVIDSVEILPNPIEEQDTTYQPIKHTETNTTQHEYIDSFIINSMQCDTIEKFKELILTGSSLGIPKAKIIKELRYVSKDMLLAYCHALNIKQTVMMTREDLAVEILSTLDY